MGEIEAAADFLAVHAARRGNTADDAFSAALSQLREVVAARQASGRALRIMEAEGATSGEVGTQAKKQLVDALIRVIQEDPEFGHEVKSAVDDVDDAASAAGSRTTIINRMRDASGTIIQAGIIYGGLHQNQPPRRPGSGD